MYECELPDGYEIADAWLGWVLVDGHGWYLSNLTAPGPCEIVRNTANGQRQATDEHSLLYVSTKCR